MLYSLSVQTGLSLNIGKAEVSITCACKAENDNKEAIKKSK
jgi:hypothetical protein